MRFFEDFSVDTSKKIGITHLLSNITTRDGSHKGGWARLLKCQLWNKGYRSVKILNNKDSVNDFDVIIFDLGAEYSGALNMFGGLDEKVFKRLVDLKNFTGDLFSWRNELPNLSCLEGRRANNSSCEAFKQTESSFLSEVQSVLDKCKVFDHVYKTDKLLIGDSHTPSVWTPEYMIERRDGRTLKGMVEKETIAKYIKLFSDSGVQIYHLNVHCSSIDIRHHLQREEDPPRATAELAASFCQQIATFGFTTVKINHTMGIEDESRELPKTGYFKGTPFFGSWHQRNLLRDIFNTTIEICGQDYGWEIVKFPKYFFDESGKLRFDMMEKPQSVHLSPEHYQWNLDANSNRWMTSGLLHQIEKDMYGAR